MVKKQTLLHSYEDIEHDDVDPIARALNTNFLNTDPLVNGGNDIDYVVSSISELVK